MKICIKTPVIKMQLLLIFFAVMALPQFASAAKKFNTIAASPTTTNIMAGVATNVSTVITLTDAGTGSSVGSGSNCFYSVSLSTADPTLTVTLSVTNFTSVENATQTLTTLTVATTAATLSNTIVVTVWANASPSNSTFITPISTTFTITMVNGGPFNPVMTWNPAGVNANWSTPNNWSPNGPPTSSNDVYFNDTGAVGTASNVDNIVNSSLNIGSLNYTQTNGANFHTTQIASGMTLTLVDSNGLTAGSGTDLNINTINTITGVGGKLVMNNPAAGVVVTQPNPSGVSPVTATATVDMSGLDVFQATISKLLVGVDVSLKGDNGTLKLARTNMITMTPGSLAPQIDIGDNSQTSAVTAGAVNVLLLGQTNAFLVDSIAVGRGRVDLGGTMLFNSAFNSPTAYFRGTNGSASRVGTWSIGDGNNGKIASSHGTNDFSLGSVDAMVNTMTVGVGSTASTVTTGSGTLILSAGTINVNNLNVGVTPSAGAVGNGTVNVTGGTLLVNTNLELANGAGSSGTLNLSGGTLTVSNSIIAGTGTSIINVSGPGALIIPAGNAGTQASPITDLDVTNAIIDVAAQNDSPAIFANTLSAGGTTNIINVTSLPILFTLPSQFPIIVYSNLIGTLATTIGGTVPSGYTGYISNNSGNFSIDVVITAGPVAPIYLWTGGQDASWNFSSIDWSTNGVATHFTQGGLLVQFTDSGPDNVNLSTTGISVGSQLTVSNNLSNYTFSGTGGLSSGMTLVKSGSASLTLAETGGDNFTGGINITGGSLTLDNASSAITGNTTITDGTLQVGNGDTKGSLPGNVANAGTLILDRADSLSFGNTISGSGVIEQIGSDIVTLSGNSTFAGTAIVTNGTLQVGSTNGLGLVTAVTLTNAGTLDVNGFALYGNGNTNLVVYAAGAGSGGNGAIVNNGTNQTKVLHAVTLTADATFGGSGNWDIRESKSPAVDASLTGAFNLTKVGTNTVTIEDAVVDGGLGNINVMAGTLDFNAGTTTLGNPASTIYVYTNATFVLDSLTSVMTKNIVLYDGSTLKGSGNNGSSGPVLFTGFVSNVLGTETYNCNSNSFLEIAAPISGAGSLTKNGAGIVFLGSVNTYTGSTLVSGGELALTNYGGDASISASTNINIGSGATLDVTGRSDGTLTLSSGQTLSGGGVGTNGPGFINGFVSSPAGSTVAPGVGGTNYGTLSVSSNLTLAGSTIMKISSTNNDQLDASLINYGGSLLVTNIFGTITNGQSFTLFVSTNGYPQSFASVTLPTASGLTWSNKLNINGTIIAGVVASLPQPGITGVSLVAGNIIINGTNGSGTYHLLTSTNVTTPLTNWTVLSTGTFSSSNFSITNAVNPSAPAGFFTLRVP